MKAEKSEVITHRPIIAVTMGDPCGVGPEVIVKGFMDRSLSAVCRPVIIGNTRWMAEAAARFAPGLIIRPIKAISEATFQEAVIDLFDPTGQPLPTLEYGKIDPKAAAAAFEAIQCAAALALRGDIDGIATAPIHKEGMKGIGFPFPGHTEFFADFAKADRFAMMMVGGGLRITLTTIHLALKKAIAELRKETILEAIRLTDTALQSDFGIQAPRTAVAALNPHAGESGIFGEEEKRVVLPAVEAAQQEGMSVFGPYPADTLFHQLKEGRFDAAVSLYHDQALIPIKLLAFGNAVNVTIGLPFIRTSVDHGTAYDIAGKGIADPGSLRAAVRLAAEMTEARRRPQYRGS
ncbi:MAG: 4-hydroxythreonine-4-phosphate dehydrogenase PdxA [Candidatus Manganitrophaceae bacterium]